MPEPDNDKPPLQPVTFGKVTPESKDAEAKLARMTNLNLNNCIKCGRWVAPYAGEIKDDGIICDDCKLLERGQIAVEYDANNGKIKGLSE